MHTLLKVTMCDVPAANSAIKDGRLQKVVQEFSKMIKPEATYFYSDQGYRCGIFIFDMKDASQIPSLAEPFFIELNAKVEIIPAMDANELAQGLSVWHGQSMGRPDADIYSMS